MLHHYDRIGLLEPDERTGSGHYRRYGPESVERLHRILSYRELELSLDEIATLLDDPHADRLAHLRRQERLLRDRIGRLEEMVGWLLVIRARPAWSWFANGPGPAICVLPTHAGTTSRSENWCSVTSVPCALQGDDRRTRWSRSRAATRSAGH
jgi:hypothetical protein